MIRSLFLAATILSLTLKVLDSGTVVLAWINVAMVVEGVAGNLMFFFDWPSISLEKGLGLFGLVSFTVMKGDCVVVGTAVVVELNLFLRSSRALSISFCFSRSLLITLLLTRFSEPEALLKIIVGSSNKFSNLVGTSIDGTSVTNEGIELSMSFSGVGAVSAVGAVVCN